MTHKHIQAKANTDKLCETIQNQRYSPIKKDQMQPWHPIRALPAPWVLSTMGKLLWYLRRSYLWPDRNPSFYVLFLYFPLFYFPVLYIYIRSAIIRLVHSNWALSPRYNYKTHPLTADWLQVCFGTWSNTAVKSIFLKLLSAPLKHQLIDGFEIIKE